MKVGIMSMQRVVNYGSFLQAYALKKVIEEMGHSVEFVDYKVEPPAALPAHAASSMPSSGPSLLVRAAKMLSPQYRRWRKKQIRMNESFGLFVREYRASFLPMLGADGALNICPKEDVLVIGSDEVFNCTQTNENVGYSRQLFGRDHNAGRLISYAASFGSTTLEKLEACGIREEVGDMLRSFDALSVRDDNSLRIVAETAGRTAEKHVDPVFLYAFPESDQLQIKKDFGDYLLVYAYADRINEEEARAIRSFAEKNNLKILSLGFYQPFCDEYVLASPFEVLSYVKNASYVITDTFHGTVFSIKYQKKFGTLVRDSNKQKINDLLATFKLESRSIGSAGSLEAVTACGYDHDSVKRLIEKHKKAALRYLADELKQSGSEKN